MNELLIEVAGGVLVGLSLGMVGAGGAIFTVPIFSVLLGHSAKAAILEALAVTGAIAAMAGTRAAFSREVDWMRVLLLGVPGIAGAALAAPLAKVLPSAVQVGLFALVSGIAAWRMWVSASKGAIASASASEGDSGEPRGARSMVRTGAIGFGIGVLTSVLGVGGGFLLIPALVLLERVPMQRAIGTSLVVIAMNASSGMTGAFLSGAIEAAAPMWRSVAIVAGCGMAGSLLGRALSERIPQRLLRQIFAGVLAVVAFVMLARPWMGA